MTPKIELFVQKFAHFGSCGGSFLTILGSKLICGNFPIFENHRANYLYSLLTITDALLCGPADALYREKSAGFNHLYLYSLLPITDALLWGPADTLYYEKSAEF